MDEYLELSAADAARLAEPGPLGPDLWIGAACEYANYGDNWNQLLANAFNANDLLANAAFAGRIGYSDFGIPLVIRSSYRAVLAQAETSLRQGADGDAASWLDADPFRCWSAICDEAVFELEERLAELIVSGPDGSARIDAGSRRRSEAAKRRADTAWARGRQAQRDMRAHERWR